METVRGARGLFGVRAAALGWYVLSTFIWLLPMDGHGELWFRASSVVWLAFAVAELVAVASFSQGRQGTPAESPARALLIFVAVVLFLTVVQVVPELGGPPLFSGSSMRGAIGLADTAMFIGAEICLWLALARSLEQPPEWSVAFYALVALKASIGSLHLLMRPDAYFDLLKQPVAGFALRWGRFGVGVVQQILPLLLLRQLLTGGAAASTAPSAPSAKAAPGRDIAVGAAWLGGGLLVTLISYSAAAASEGGGRYVVATGAIAYGLVRLVRGFVRLGG